MRDSLGNDLSVDVFHVPILELEATVGHLVGLRESSATHSRVVVGDSQDGVGALREGLKQLDKPAKTIIFGVALPIICVFD